MYRFYRLRVDGASMFVRPSVRVSFPEQIGDFFYIAHTQAGLVGSFESVVAQDSEVLGSNPGRVSCLSSRLCIYSATNCSKDQECAVLLMVLCILRALEVIR